MHQPLRHTDTGDLHPRTFGTVRDRHGAASRDRHGTFRSSSGLSRVAAPPAGRRRVPHGDGAAFTPVLFVQHVLALHKRSSAQIWPFLFTLHSSRSVPFARCIICNRSVNRSVVTELFNGREGGGGDRPRIVNKHRPGPFRAHWLLSAPNQY